jgi:hypothetical protein
MVCLILIRTPIPRLGIGKPLPSSGRNNVAHVVRSDIVLQ